MYKKTLYLECFSGISGDMTVASLLDLGANEELLREALHSLEVHGYDVEFGRTSKCGIDTCDFNVILHQDEHNHEHTHNHDHIHRNVCDIYKIIDKSD